VHIIVTVGDIVMPLSKKETRTFIATLERMPDERVRYFYLMLGDAIASHEPMAMPVLSNTGPAQLAELEARLRAG
jgi:hypothetical protein